MNKQQRIMVGMIGAALWSPIGLAAEHDQSMHMQHQKQAASPDKPAIKETRQAVKFPAQLREHTLANMRDHLLALQQIQEELARQDFDKAGDIAEQRLGMSFTGASRSPRCLEIHAAGDAGNRDGNAPQCQPLRYRGQGCRCDR